jgi:hypothetical protein
MTLDGTVYEETLGIRIEDAVVIWQTERLFDKLN